MIQLVVMPLRSPFAAEPTSARAFGEEGFGNVVGSPRPGGTLGVFIDDYLVWARTPPRGNRKGDPSFGQI